MSSITCSYEHSRHHDRAICSVLFLGIQRMDASYPHHVDVKNPHSFEARDLEKLIQKVK